MKLKSFLAMLMCAAMLVACSEDNDDPVVEPEEEITATGVSLDQTDVTLEIGETVTLVATLSPDGAEGTITFASSDTSVATVDSDTGLVEAIAAGTASVVASCGSLTATCAVTVNAGEATTYESLQGTDYYIIAMDYLTFADLDAAGVVVADLRVDDLNSFLYIWNGYEAGTCSGANSYGLTETWTSLYTASGASWTGLGHYVGVNEDYTGINELHNVTDAPDEFYLHIALKASDAVAHQIKLESIGDGSYVFGSYSSSYPWEEFDTDGEWHHFDIPMTTFTEQGFAFNPSFDSATNVLCILSGATEGMTLDYDAVFFYKK